MVRKTLVSMAAGGIHDQLAGGFHRYSTDRAWLLPHFEKMLYDQALIALAYAEAYEVTKAPLFAKVARETLDFVLREMRSGEGGFVSAIGADRPTIDPKSASGATRLERTTCDPAS